MILTSYIRTRKIKTFNQLNNKAETPTQFLNSIMSILFTFEERSAGFVGDEDKKSRSTRKSLDPEKINLLKSEFYYDLNFKKYNLTRFLIYNKYLLNF